jgi:serralysin
MTDASLVNAALGIDASIDVSIFDPVANKGDGGINDYLYEKGNQLTVLAYALQNITNDLNTTTETTQDYFKAITEEVEKEFTETTTKVDIETEAFITKALDNVIAAKTLTITDEAKANTTKALSGVMPIIEVKSSNDLTTSVIRFAVSTLQTDIQAIANGTATEETVASYTTDVLTYIATDQNIDADEITPDISAIADSASTSEDTPVDINVLANDSYLTSAPITVTAANGSNGASSLSNNLITYTPNADFNGTDTFTYTITQGDKSSSADITVTIGEINDAPSINSASTISVAENQTAVTTISISDPDSGDVLTLSLSGADAESFDLSTDNVLTFITAPDYETKSSYSITLSLTDGTETVSKDISVTVTNVNDVAPVITSMTSLSADENQLTIGTVTAADVEGNSFTFTVSGSELAITSAGVLTFVTAPDYETKSSFTATVTVSDGLNSSSKVFTITVNDLDEIPKTGYRVPTSIDVIETKE